MRMTRRTAVQIAGVLVSAALLTSACSAGGGPSQSASEGANPSMDHSSMGGGDFGRPGKAANASRVVEITQTDGPSFDPSEVSVEPGETVTFRISNKGQAPHEFVLGDEALQQAHSQEMSDLVDGAVLMGDEPNAIGITPGEVGTITWTFPESGEVTFACHVPGHYEAGMKGIIRIG